MYVTYRPISFQAVNNKKMNNTEKEIVNNLSKFLKNELSNKEFDKEMNNTLKNYDKNSGDKWLKDIVTSYKLIDDVKSIKDDIHLSHTRFRYDAMNTLQGLKNNGKYLDLIKDDYSKYLI